MDTQKNSDYIKNTLTPLLTEKIQLAVTKKADELFSSFSLLSRAFSNLSTSTFLKLNKINLKLTKDERQLECIIGDLYVTHYKIRFFNKFIFKIFIKTEIHNSTLYVNIFNHEVKNELEDISLYYDRIDDLSFIDDMPDKNILIDNVIGDAYLIECMALHAIKDTLKPILLD